MCGSKSQKCEHGTHLVDKELPNLGFSSPNEFRIVVSILRVKGQTIRNPSCGTFVALTSAKVNYAQTLWSLMVPQRRCHESPKEATNVPQMPRTSHRGSVITTKSLRNLKSKGDFP